MTNSGKNGLNIRTNASPKWDRTKCPEEYGTEPSLYFFRADRKTKIAALVPDWLRHFRLIPDPLKLLNGNWLNLTGRKNSRSSIKFVFFGPIGKPRWPPLPLIVWGIFDFSFETAEQNLTGSKIQGHLPNLSFWTDEKTKMATRILIGWDIFDFSSETLKRN